MGLNKKENKVKRRDTKYENNSAGGLESPS